jgi:hypothetical protein
VQPRANPTIIAISTARRFITGSVPGSAATKGVTSEFGSRS